jgi:ABC-type lipoprotein export system ATPase subunit
MQAENDSAAQQSIFIEQAEYIETVEFHKWTAEHPDEEMIIRKLSQTGAKLITGPRGCGKTTLMLKASYKLLADDESQTLPVYVNFKSSLKLEPFYKRNANAAFWFNQWLLYKTYLGLFEALDSIDADHPNSLKVTAALAKNITSRLELGRTDLSLPDEHVLSVRGLEADIEKVLDALDKKRCILLLDDAAHAFSPDQQRDFFEFFRQVKSKLVSPKAAIYPGVTVYSPTFHVGHDAEEIDVWLRPDSQEYIPFMLSLLERRLAPADYDQLRQDRPLLTLLCYAAFGMPRALLNMVRSCIKADKLHFDRPTGLAAIKSYNSNTMGLFTSLKDKLPMYSRYVTVGTSVFDYMVEAIKAYNQDKPVDHQSVTSAIKRPVPVELSRVFGFFQYAGLLLPKGELSKGEKGIFDQYTVHYATLIDRNALLGKKGVRDIAAFADALGKRRSSEFTRMTPKALLGTEDTASVLSISLPPCQVCKQPRINEEAKFCISCGSQLKSISIFETLVEQPISELPLTSERVKKIKANSRIRTIKDILMDHENRELRKVPQIGPYWAKRIYRYAEEHIA